MLDEKTEKLLEKINGFGEGSCKVVDEGELMGLYPAGEADKESIRQMLGFLEDRRYIDVQYAEEGVYCVRPLPEGRLYFEKLREGRRETVRLRRDVALFSALGALVGSLVGAAMMLLVSLL